MRSMVGRTLTALAIIGLGTFVAASPGRAFFSFDVTATSTGDLQDYPVPGDEITLNIRLRNSGPIFGLGAAVYGYSPSIVSFVSGQVVGEMLRESCGGRFCPGVLENQVTTPVESSAVGVGPFVQFATAVNVLGTTADGTLDPGLDGSTTDALFRLTFRVLQWGQVEFWVGTNDSPSLGNVIIRADGATELAATHLTFVPEPGSALLVGLGLAWLTGAGAPARRRRVGADLSPGR